MTERVNDPVYVLPLEVVILVFRELRTDDLFCCSLVSHAWLQAVRHPAVWLPCLGSMLPSELLYSLLSSSSAATSSCPSSSNSSSSGPPSSSTVSTTSSSFSSLPTLTSTTTATSGYASAYFPLTTCAHASHKSVQVSAIAPPPTLPTLPSLPHTLLLLLELRSLCRLCYSSRFPVEPSASADVHSPASIHTSMQATSHAYALSRDPQRRYSAFVAPPPPSQCQTLVHDYGAPPLEQVSRWPLFERYRDEREQRASSSRHLPPHTLLGRAGLSADGLRGSAPRIQLCALYASSVDMAEQLLDTTLDDLPSTFWSSKGSSDPDSSEVVIFGVDPSQSHSPNAASLSYSSTSSSSSSSSSSSASSGSSTTTSILPSSSSSLSPTSSSSSLTASLVDSESCTCASACTASSGSCLLNTACACPLGFAASCALFSAVLIRSFRAHFQTGMPFYPPRAVRISVGFEHGAYHYVSPLLVYPNVSAPVLFRLPALTVGRVLRIELVGRRYRQPGDELFYTVLGEVAAFGLPFSMLAARTPTLACGLLEHASGSLPATPVPLPTTPAPVTPASVESATSSESAPSTASSTPAAPGSSTACSWLRPLLILPASEGRKRRRTRFCALVAAVGSEGVRENGVLLAHVANLNCFFERVDELLARALTAERDADSLSVAQQLLRLATHQSAGESAPSVQVVKHEQLYLLSRIAERLALLHYHLGGGDATDRHSASEAVAATRLITHYLAERGTLRLAFSPMERRVFMLFVAAASQREVSAGVEHSRVKWWGMLGPHAGGSAEVDEAEALFSYVCVCVRHGQLPRLRRFLLLVLNMIQRSNSMDLLAGVLLLLEEFDPFINTLVQLQPFYVPDMVCVARWLREVLGPGPTVRFCEMLLHRHSVPMLALDELRLVFPEAPAEVAWSIGDAVSFLNSIH